MAWTTPRTWVTGEVVTSSLMNTHIRDNELALVRAGVAANLAAKTDLVTVTNTTSATSLYDGSTSGNTTGWPISAGLISTDRLLRLVLFGRYVYNSSNAAVTWSVLLRDGAGSNLTLFSLASTTSNTSASSFPYWMDVYLAAKGSANSQWGWGTLHDSVGGVLPVDIMSSGDDAATAMDMSAATYLDVTMTFDTATTSLSVSREYAILTVF